MALQAQSIEAAKLRLLAGSPGPLIGAGMTGVLASAALWPYVDHRLLGVWAAGMLLCTMSRFVVWRRFRRDSDDDDAVVRWVWPLTIGIAVSGTLWGLFGVSFYLVDDAEIRGFILLVLASMLASGTVFYFAYLPAHGAYVLGCALPVAAASFQHGSATSILFGSMTFAYIALILRGARLFNRNIEDTFRLQFHNADLIVGLQAAKEAAVEASHTKSRFLANMSHELRTPLNAVIGYSEMMLEEAALDGRTEQVADLRKIHTAGTHLLSLVNDVLDLSKIEAGKADLCSEGFDLAGVVDDVVETCGSLVRKNGNTLEVVRGPDLGTAIGDATKLRQIALNLLSNAAKFTKNGRITLAAARRRDASGDWIEFSVHDTGIGIGRENIDKLFKNFSQVESSIARKYGGTGLGLALSQQLCQLMGGSIAVESELGRGSCFTVRIPASVEGAPAPRGPLGVEPRGTAAA